MMMFGAMPDLQDNTGRTALMHAIENDISDERQKGRTAEIMLSFGRMNPMHQDAYEMIKADAREVFDFIAPETRGQGRIVLNPIRHELDLQDVDGETALIKAVEQGDLRLVRLLIEDGANAGLKDRQGRTAFDAAQRLGYDAMAGYLAKAQPELHAAAVVGDMARMRELLASDVPVDGKDVNGRTPLMLASANGHLRAMLLLIMNGANEREKDTRHRTPLMHAAEAGQHRAVDLLGDLMILSFRDDVQARFERLDRELFAGVDFAAMKFDVGFDLRDQSGETALMKAARGGHIEGVHMLIRRDNGRRDANQELQDHQKRTALAHAILADQREFLEAMVTTRTESYRTSATSWTPMPTLMSVDVLLLEDSEGRNGLQLLESHGFDDIAQQLRNRLRAARDELTKNIEAGESDKLSLLFRWRSPLWRLFGETEKAESDLAESERLKQ
jgi:ankyrin repeat protein